MKVPTRTWAALVSFSRPSDPDMSFEHHKYKWSTCWPETCPSYSLQMPQKGVFYEIATYGSQNWPSSALRTVRRMGSILMHSRMPILIWIQEVKKIYVPSNPASGMLVPEVDMGLSFLMSLSWAGGNQTNSQVRASSPFEDKIWPFPRVLDQILG